MISVMLVYVLMGFLLYEAVQRTIHMNYEINGDVMLITAAVGVAVNVIMGFLLNQSRTQPLPVARLGALGLNYSWDGRLCTGANIGVPGHRWLWLPGGAYCSDATGAGAQAPGAACL